MFLSEDNQNFNHNDVNMNKRYIITFSNRLKNIK
jgi:hypothetical protein